MHKIYYYNVRPGGHREIYIFFHFSKYRAGKSVKQVINFELPEEGMQVASLSPFLLVCSLNAGADLGGGGSPFNKMITCMYAHVHVTRGQYSKNQAP